MTTFNLTIDLSDHEHPENPRAQRALVVQLLNQAAGAIGSNYVDPRVKNGDPDVGPDHHSVRHAAGDIVYSARAFDSRKIGSWEFTDEEG